MIIKFCLLRLTGMLIVCIMNSSCKKETPATSVSYPRFPPPLVQLNPEGLAFVQLPPGRYFAYEDSSTGTIDTAYVSQSSYEKKFRKGIMGSSSPGCVMCNGSSDYYYQEFTLRLSTKNGQEWFKGIASTGLIDRYFYGSDSLFISPGFNLNNCFWYPFISSGQYSIFHVIPVLTIRGVPYSDVHVFSTFNGLQPTDLHYNAIKLYWVKGIGIVQKEIRSFNSVQTSFLFRYW